jgi:hypothetical protein
MSMPASSKIAATFGGVDEASDARAGHMVVSWAHRAFADRTLTR